MKISVITITYNNLFGLRRTCNSVLSQTCRDFEWVVIDGNSKDGSKEYLESLSQQPDFWVSEPDSGIYNAMNKGIAHSQGEYLIFMNSGDIFYDEYVVQHALEKWVDADIVYGDAMFCEKDGERMVHYPDEFMLYDFWRSYTPCHQASFIRATLLRDNGGYDESYKITADYSKWIEWKLENRSFRHIDVVVCRYYLDGISSVNLELHHQEHDKVINKWLTPCMIEEMKLIEKTIKRFDDYVGFVRAQFKHGITLCMGRWLMMIKDKVHHRDGVRKLDSGYVYDPRHPFERP